MPDKKTATILGKDQKLSGVSRTADGLALSWNGPLKDTAGEEHKIAVRMDVKAAGNELQIRPASRQPHRLQGQGGLVSDDRRAGQVRRAGKACRRRALGSDLHAVDQEDRAALRLGRPSAYPGKRTCRSPACKARRPRSRSTLPRTTRLPATKSITSRSTPKTSAKDVFACIQHFPFTPPGKTFDGSTVVLRVVDGDWRAAGRVYRAWFEKTFGICKPSDCWIRRQSFFQITMFELPEGTINYRFKDIPQWAKDAKDHGINSVQISGWHLGGHDNGYPYYIVDPRLGTWQELEDGIKACHKMGLKVYFFVNYQQVMIDSDWYKKELVKYRE